MSLLNLGSELSLAYKQAHIPLATNLFIILCPSHGQSYIRSFSSSLNCRVECFKETRATFNQQYTKFGIKHSNIHEEKEMNVQINCYCVVIVINNEPSILWSTVKQSKISGRDDKTARPWCCNYTGDYALSISVLCCRGKPQENLSHKQARGNILSISSGLTKQVGA